jgi:hypothetical protein
VKCCAEEGDGGIAFGKGVATTLLLDYLVRRVEYNKEAPPTAEQKAAFAEITRALPGVSSQSPDEKINKRAAFHDLLHRFMEEAYEEGRIAGRAEVSLPSQGNPQ